MIVDRHSPPLVSLPRFIGGGIDRRSVVVELLNAPKMISTSNLNNLSIFHYGPYKHFNIYPYLKEIDGRGQFFSQGF